jgi:hypothetical protein
MGFFYSSLPRCWLWSGPIFVLLLQRGTSFAASPTTLYNTGFEEAQGYISARPLIGQRGWIGTDILETFSTGLIVDGFPGFGQQAYIGFNPLSPGLGSLNLWQPLDLAPVPTNTPIVKFSVLMEIVDSDNGEYDCFRWSVYNTNQNRLFTLDFDNLKLTVCYLLENSTHFVSTDQTFANGTRYALLVRMDFGRNTWSATLNDVLLATNLPITVANSPLNLGDIDAVWFYGQPDSPGNNYMVFDNYQVTVEPRPSPPPPRLTALGRLNNQFLMRLTGEPNTNYVIDATTSFTNWLALRTNNTGNAGSFDFLDVSSPSFPRRFYRGRLVP